MSSSRLARLYALEQKVAEEARNALAVWTDLYGDIRKWSGRRRMFELHAFIGAVYEYPPLQYQLTWIDEEGDECLISSDPELLEAIDAAARRGKILRIKITPVEKEVLDKQKESKEKPNNKNNNNCINKEEKNKENQLEKKVEESSSVNDAAVSATVPDVVPSVVRQSSSTSAAASALPDCLAFITSLPDSEFPIDSSLPFDDLVDSLITRHLKSHSIAQRIDKLKDNSEALQAIEEAFLKRISAIMNQKLMEKIRLS